MPRPRKQRSVQPAPEVVVYKPAGIPARLLEWVTLTLDEFEALRQIDHEGKDQETVAAGMGVSRPTVTRLYQSARKKIADVLVNGLALKIEGGPVITVPASKMPRGRGCGCGRKRGHKGRCCGQGDKEENQG